MTDLIYEQPLNEKVRSYLRLEYLSQQLQANLDTDHGYRCFYPLFALCELAERCDYRSDILKDIDRQLQLLKTWRASPSADLAQIDQLIEDLNSNRDALQVPGRIGSELKQDRFLQALRQRFNMPGACCNFDLPQLHYWQAQTFAKRSEAYQQWIDPFSPLLNSVKQLLQLTRDTARYSHQCAQAGFYQGNSEVPLSLIRVKIDPAQGCYPTISGHRNRYAIHFVDFNEQRHSDISIEFQLAACR